MLLIVACVVSSNPCEKRYQIDERITNYAIDPEKLPGNWENTFESRARTFSSDMSDSRIYIEYTKEYNAARINFSIYQYKSVGKSKKGYIQVIKEFSTQNIHELSEFEYKSTIADDIVTRCITTVTGGQACDFFGLYRNNVLHLYLSGLTKEEKLYVITRAEERIEKLLQIQ